MSVAPSPIPTPMPSALSLATAVQVEVPPVAGLPADTYNGAGHVVLMRNARSGRERAVEVSERILEALMSAAGERARDGAAARSLYQSKTPSQPTPFPLPLGGGSEANSQDVRVVDASAEGQRLLPEALRGAKALVICGGDGTVHHALRPAMSAGVPVYHVPLGNENLFSREFGMTGEPGRLLGSLESGAVRRVDVGTLNGSPFAIMVSVGFDANVVQRVAAARVGGVSHWSYVRAGAGEVLRPRWPRLRVRVDGRTVVDGQSGLLLVANSRQYAARLDPARRAVMDDGRLDVMFLPASSLVGLSVWAGRIVLSRHLRHRRSVHQLAHELEIEYLDGPTPVQVDGEFAGELTGVSKLGVMAKALRVLVPPSA